MLDHCIKSDLANNQPNDETTHPLYLCKLSFHLIASFMKKCLMKKIDRPGLSDESIIFKGMLSNKVTIHLKPSWDDAVQSSLANICHECNLIETSVTQQQNYGRWFFCTRRRIIVNEHVRGRRLGFGWWIAPHLLLLLDWNLISCADSVVTSNIEIVGIWNDAIWFQIGVTKTN